MRRYCLGGVLLKMKVLMDVPPMHVELMCDCYAGYSIINGVSVCLTSSDPDAMIHLKANIHGSTSCRFIACNPNEYA